VTILEFLKSAYTIGGATAVLVACLIYAVVTLYKRLQAEHEEHLSQARNDTELMRQLMETVVLDATRNSRHGEELQDYDDEDDSTNCTYRQREHTRRRAKKLIDSYRPKS
jgi:hypothetical protein